MTRFIFCLIFLLGQWTPAFAGGVTGNLSPGTVVSIHPGLTTQATQLAPRLSHTIDVMDDVSPPVVCDGKTDNAKAFAAIYAAEQPGDTVYFPPSFGASGVVPCLSSTLLQGKAGVDFWAYPGTVILSPTASSAASPLLFEGGSNEYVYGLTFDGGGQSFASTSTVVLFYLTSGVTMDHVTVQNTRGIGALFSGATNDTVKDSWFVDVGGPAGITDNAQGLAFCCGTEATNTGDSVLDNHFLTTGLDAISASNLNGLLVEGNYCDKNQDQVGQPADPACVFITQSIGPVVVAGNVAIGMAGNGYDLSSLTSVTLTGNYAIDNGSNGFTDYGIANWSALGNYAIDNCQVGTRFGPCAGFTFSPGTAAEANGSMTMVGNEAYDDQNTHTQQYGVYNSAGTTFSEPWSVGKSNIFYGNTVSQMGGGGPVAGYTP
jgi:hypothetical protein